MITPALSVSPSQSTLDMVLGSSDVPTADLQIMNDSDGHIFWEATSSEEWLLLSDSRSADNASQTVSGLGPSGLLLEVDPSLLSPSGPETVTATVTVAAEGPTGVAAPGSPVSVLVTLNIWQVLGVEDGLPGAETNGIYVAEPGEVWVGTNRGAARVTPDELEAFTKSNSGLADNRVNAIIGDGQGSIWFGTGIGWNDAEGGLSRFYPDGDTWITYTYQNTHQGLALNTVISFGIDPGNTLWVGTAGGGVSRYDGTDWETFNTGTTPEIGGDFILDLAADPDGELWLGSDQGLGFFDGSNWIGYPEVTSGVVTAVAVGPEGEIWVGAGAECLLLSGGTWSSFVPDSSESPTAVIEEIAVEPGGTVWIGTSAGLFRYRDDTFETIRFNGVSWNVPVTSIALEPREPSGYTKWIGTPSGVYLYPGE